MTSNNTACELSLGSKEWLDRESVVIFLTSVNSQQLIQGKISKSVLS